MVHTQGSGQSQRESRLLIVMITFELHSLVPITYSTWQTRKSSLSPIDFLMFDSKSLERFEILRLFLISLEKSQGQCRVEKPSSTLFEHQ